jgi:hypothetical protein
LSLQPLDGENQSGQEGSFLQIEAVSGEDRSVRIAKDPALEERVERSKASQDRICLRAIDRVKGVSTPGKRWSVATQRKASGHTVKTFKSVKRCGDAAKEREMQNDLGQVGRADVA